MNLSRAAVIVGIVFGGAWPVSSAQAPESWAGVWILNLAKSSYQAGPAPKSATSRLEPFRDGWKGSQDLIDAQGRPDHVDLTFKFDGRDYAVNGAFNTTWAFTRIDDRTYELVAKHDGKVMARARTVVSADGKTRTTTATSTNAQGQTVKNVAVYDRP